MSWKDYIDTSLIGSGFVDKAAIISLAGDSVWAASTGFDLKPEEMKNLSAIAKNDTAVVEKLHSDGVHISGERFVVAKTEVGYGYVRAAKDDNDPEKAKEGVVIFTTKQTVIVAHHDRNSSAANANKAAGGLADYLTKLNF